MWLDQPVTESLEQGNTIFEDFDNFLQKQNTFQKQLKHFKIVLYLINKDWACENTFNQVQHTNEYDIHWTYTCVMCVDINNEIVLSLM